ncbi:MAG: hypothetical protein Q9163_003626 [Psora crenata]
MQSPFGAKRKPRTVGRDQEDEGGGHDNGHQDHEPAPAVIRPSLSTRGSLKSRKRSSLRTSFGPGGTSMNDDGDDDASPSTIFTPKRSNLSRQAIEKNALRKSLAPSISSDHLSLRHNEDRPSYSADTLNELRASTPSTPKDLGTSVDLVAQCGQEIDLAFKFGSDLALQHSSVIPTDAEIKEKKQRRARLAKEQEYITLNSDGEPEDNNDLNPDSDASSNDETSLLPYTTRKPLKEAPSRLAQDDEEIGEGFDDFVSDGRIALDRKAEREQRKRQKEEMRTMIEDAEASDDSSEDESEIERRAAYEAAQTRRGMDGLKKREGGARPRRPRTPPRITPLPTLGGVLERLKERKQGREFGTRVKKARLESVQQELADIEARKGEVQRLMKEAGERFEKLRAEVEGANMQTGERGGEMVLGERTGLGMNTATEERVRLGANQNGLESWGNG